jgi:sodium/bile acid cotransporter 7
MYDRYAAAAAAKGTAWPGIDAEAILAPSDSEVGTPAIPWHDRFLFIDTRTQSERNISQIPGSVTTSDFEDLLKRDPPGLGGKQPVAYCTIGYRSGNYCTRINSSATIPDTIKVLNLKGSVLAWIHAGG